MNKKWITNISFLPGIGLWFVLFLMPTAEFYIRFNQPFQEALKEAPSLYSKLEIPKLYYSPYEIRSNQDKLFERLFEGPNGEKVFYLIIDTSDRPDPGLFEKVKEANSGGLVIYRKEFVIYNAATNETVRLPYEKLGIQQTFVIDQDKVGEWIRFFGKYFFYFFVFSVMMFHAAGKTVWWLIITFFFSGKAKHKSLNAYSIALWSLFPPTIVQVLIPTNCLGCGFYFIVLIITVILLDQKMVVTSSAVER